MEIKDNIIKAEREAPKAFASYIEKDYGIIFFNEDNKQSHDSNHAVLYADKITDIEYTLLDIRDFYLSKGITPRIYRPFITGYFENHRKAFEKAGYKIEIYGVNRYMLLMKENNIKTNKNLVIKQLLEWDERIADDILIPNNEEHEIDVIKNLLKQKDSYVFVGFLNDVAVVTTYFHVSEYNCTSFDYIVTAKNYRKNGYAKEILSHAVDFCRQNNIPNCYQWPAHKVSEKICYEAGFRVIFEVEAAAAIYNSK